VTAPKRGKRAQLELWLSQRGAEPCPAVTETRLSAIGEAEFAELLTSLAPISENYLKKLLRDSGAPLAPIIAGVRQSNLDELESSLLALLDEYERGDPPRRAAVRHLVITAKDHARWAPRKSQPACFRPEHGTGPGHDLDPGPPPDRASPVLGAASPSDERESSKSEMILWMVTWLENPPVFREWVGLRRIQLARLEPTRVLNEP
jgi:hypothetical protein